MNLKPTTIEFNTSEEVLQSLPSPLENSKLRTSYGGGFRMFKNSGRSSMVEPSEPLYKNLKKELQDLQTKTRRVSEKAKKGRDSLEPMHHIEENKHIENLEDLEQLQVLKEQKAQKIIQLEAEIRRAKLEETRGKPQKLEQPKKTAQVKNISKEVEEYRKRFEAKFTEYVERKKGKSPEISKNQEIIEKNQEIIETKMNEKEIFLRWMFKKLDTTSEGFITLDQLIHEVSNNLDLSQLFKIPEDLTEFEEIQDYFLKMVKTLGISPERGLNLEEFFHLADLSYINRNFESFRVIEKFLPKCLLPESLIFLFEQVFDSMLEDSDQVNKFLYLDELLSEKEVQESLGIPAVSINEQESADLASVLHYIRVDTSKDDSFLTWQEFLSYFYLNSPKVPKKCLSLFRDIFEEISEEPNVSISTYDLVSSLLKNQELQKYLKIPVNSEETIQETLLKIQDQAGSFLTFQQFLSFFSSENLPKHDEKLKKTLNLTMPDPFDFESREKEKKISIREKKFQEMMEEKRKEEEFHLKYRPKLVPVPKNVKIPIYEQMIEKQKLRSEEIKRTSVEATLQNEKPFSFYLRDKDRERPRPTSPYFERFKANPIPRSSSVQIFKEMITTGESKRKERVASRAQLMLRESSLPPRMRMYEKSSESFKKLINDGMEVRRFSITDPPDFAKLHEKFAKTLEANKKARKPTKLEPFTIDERAEEIRERREKEKGPKQEPQTFTPFKAKDPPDFPKLFEEFQNSLQRKKQEKEPVKCLKLGMEKRSEEMKEKRQKIEEDKKKAKEAQIIPKQKSPNDLKKEGNVRTLKEKLQKIINESLEKSKAKGNDLQSKALQKKRDAEEQRKKYKESLEEMNQRVYSRPLLVELDEHTKSIKLSKGRALLAIKNQLKASGMTFKNYFTEEEQQLIQLAEMSCLFNEVLFNILQLPSPLNPKNQ